MNELPKVERTTLTMKETAEYLGISYWLVNQLVRRKQIPCARVGGRVLFRVQALDEYLKEKEVGKECCLCNGLKCLQIYLLIQKCNYYLKNVMGTRSLEYGFNY